MTKSVGNFALCFVVTLAVAAGTARAGEHSDFEKGLLLLGKDARPQKLSVQVTFESTEQGLVQGKGHGSCRYDAEACLLAGKIMQEKAANIQDGKVLEWSARTKEVYVARDGGTALSGDRVRPMPAGTILPVVDAKGELNSELEPPLAFLLSAHGLDALVKICRLEASERKDEGVVWAKVVPLEGVEHSLLNRTKSQDWSLEMAVDAKTGAIRELVEKRSISRGGPDKTEQIPTETHIAFTYGDIPNDFSERLKTEVAEKRAGAGNED